jgi:hypothetical protein
VRNVSGLMTGILSDARSPTIEALIDKKSHVRLRFAALSRATSSAPGTGVSPLIGFFF